MKQLITICATTLALAACAKGSSLDPVANAKAASANKDIQGNWTSVDKLGSKCNYQNLGWLTSIVNSGEHKVVAQQVAYDFDGTNVSKTLTLFTDDQCTKPAVKFIESGIFTSPYNVNGANETSDGVKAKYIKMAFTDLELIAVNQDGADYINSSKLCGQTAIKVGDSNKQNVKASASTSCFGEKVAPSINAYSKDGDSLILASSGAADEKSTPNSGKTLSAITLVK